MERAVRSSLVTAMILGGRVMRTGIALNPPTVVAGLSVAAGAYHVVKLRRENSLRQRH